MVIIIIHLYYLDINIIFIFIIIIPSHPVKDLLPDKDDFQFTLSKGHRLEGSVFETLIGLNLKLKKLIINY